MLWCGAWLCRWLSAGSAQERTSKHLALHPGINILFTALYCLQQVVRAYTTFNRPNLMSCFVLPATGGEGVHYIQASKYSGSGYW